MFPRSIALFAALVVAFVTMSPAVAADGTVTVPYGDWIVTAAGSIASLAVALGSAVLAKWLPSWIRVQITEQVLARAVDYGLAAVAGAARGKVLEVPIANEVIREAAVYVVENAPAHAAWLGETLEKKLVARLSAAGVLPDDASWSTVGMLK